MCVCVCVCGWVDGYGCVCVCVWVLVCVRVLQTHPTVSCPTWSTKARSMDRAWPLVVSWRENLVRLLEIIYFMHIDDPFQSMEWINETVNNNFDQNEMGD